MSSQSRKELAEAGRRKLEAFRAAKKQQQQQQPKLVEPSAARNDEVYAAPAPAPVLRAPERAPSLPPAAPVEPAAAWNAPQYSSFAASQAPGGVFPPGTFPASDSAADFFESLASGGSQAAAVAAPGPGGVGAPASASAADSYAPVEYQRDNCNGYEQGQSDQHQHQATWSAYGNGDYGQATAVDPAVYDGQLAQVGSSSGGNQCTQHDASAASAADLSSQVAPAYQYDGYSTGAAAYAYPANGDYNGYQNPAVSTAVDPYAGYNTGYPQDSYATDSASYSQAPYAGYGDYSAPTPASSQWSGPQPGPGSQAAAPERYSGQQGYGAGYDYAGSDASYYQTGSYQPAAAAAESSRFGQPSTSQPSYSYSYDSNPAALPQYSGPFSDGLGAPAIATSHAPDPAPHASVSAPMPPHEPAPASTAWPGPAAAQPKASSFMSFLRDLPAAATSALTAAGAPFQPLQYRPPPSFGSPEPPKPKEEEVASPGAAHRMADQKRNEQDAEIIRRLRGGGAGTAPPGADASRGPSPPPPSAPASARPRASQEEGQWERSEAGGGAGGMNSNPSSSTGQLWGDHRQSSAPSGDFSSLQQHILDLEEKQFELRREADLQGRLVQQLTRENADMLEDLNRQSNVVSDLASEIGSLKEQLAAQGLALAAAAAERDEARGALRETGSRCRDLASEVIGLEEQVRRLKSDAYRAQSRTAEVEAALSVARAEADERLTEALKTVEFLKEQVDIQQRAYEQKLATLTDTGSGSHQEYLLRQELASLESRVKEAEQLSEMQLLAVTSAKDSEISQLRARLIEAERAASQAADEATAAHAALVQNEVKLRSAEGAAQARNLSEDPVLAAVADYLRPILAPPAVRGKGPSTPPPRPTDADVSAAVFNALEASKSAKMAVLPGEVLAALPTHGALLGDALKQIGQDTESTSLPFDAAQRLGESASASIESIFRLVAELEDEREALVSALERGKRERDRLREELRAATGEGLGRARVATSAAQPLAAGPGPGGPGRGAEAASKAGHASTTSPTGMNSMSPMEAAKEQPKKLQPPAAAPGTYFFTPAAAAPQQLARSAAPAPPPTPPRYDHGLVETGTRSAPATPARPPGADAASQPDAATTSTIAQQHVAAAKGRTRWFFGII